MRRLLLILGVLVGSVMAQTTGPPLNLNIPPHGSFPWDTQPNGGVNANWTAINVFAASTISVPGVAAGSELVSNGVAQAPVYQSKPSFDLRDYLKCDNAVTDDTAALSALLTTIGTTADAKIVFPRTKCLIGTITIPTNVVADFTVGAGVFVKTGSIITWLGKIQASAEQIFFNATTGLGGVDFTGDFSLDPIFPEWFGAYPSATAAVNTPAIQSAIYGAFGCATSPATACRANNSGLTQYNRVIQFSGQYSINDELKCYHVIGFRFIGQGKLKSGLIQTATNKRIIDSQSMAYGTFENMLFQSNATQDATHPLVDLGYSAAQGVDIRPQFITFLDDVFIGNSQTQIGVLIAKEGSGAQGSNISFYNSAAQGFLFAAAQIGGGTGAVAQNALTDLWIGGDIQGSPQFGLVSYGGQWIVQNMSMENGTTTQVGYDLYCYAPQEVCDMEHVRSESFKLVAGDRIRVVDSTTTFQVTQWTSGNLAGTVGTVGELFSGGDIGGDGIYYKVTVGGTFGGLNNTTATAGSATTITCGGCSWTVNAFTGNIVSLESGTGVLQYGIITSNTATVITVAAGWKTRFSPNQRFLSLANPDATTHFVVEPGWGTQTTSGTVTFAPIVFNVISGNLNGALDTTATNATLQNVIAVGGQINAVGNFKDVGVTRVDWDAASLPLDHQINQYSYDNIQARLPAGAGTLWRDGTLMMWSFPRNTVTGYTNVFQDNRGSKPFVWSCATTEAGASCPDVAIGGRNHPSTSANQAVLEIVGSLGAVTPNGTDQAGAPTQLQEGLSTGAGTPGGIVFRCGTIGASGTQGNDGYPCGLFTQPANFTIGKNGQATGTLGIAGVTSGLFTQTVNATGTQDTVSGQLVGPITCATPTFTFLGRTGSGMCSLGANTIDWAVNGTGVMELGAAALFVPAACDYNTGTGCFTFTNTLISTSGAGNPTLKATNGFQIGNGATATLGTTLLTTGTCAAAVTVAWTNAATTSVVVWDYASDPSGVVGYGSSGGLTVTAYATAGNANFRVCNPTAGSITPGAMSLNFRVIF